MTTHDPTLRGKSELFDQLAETGDERSVEESASAHTTKYLAHWPAAESQSAVVAGLDVSEQTGRWLRWNHITSIGTLCHLTVNDLESMTNATPFIVLELTEQLAQRGLALAEASTPISSLGLSLRAFNCLRRARIGFIAQLVSMASDDLLSIPNFGSTCLAEVNLRLAEQGLGLGRHLATKAFRQINSSDDVEPPASQNLLRSPIGELQLSVRSTNCLTAAGITTLGQLAAKTGNELLDLQNFGARCLTEIKYKLAQRGLRLEGEPYVYAEGTQPALIINLAPVSEVEIRRRNFMAELIQLAETFLGINGAGTVDELFEDMRSTPTNYSFDDSLTILQSTLLTDLVGASAESYGWHEVLTSKLSELDDRSREVITLRATIDTRATLEVVGRKLAVTRERVRQLEHRALGQISKSSAVIHAAHRLVALASPGCSSALLTSAGFDPDDPMTSLLVSIADYLKLTSSWSALRKMLAFGVPWVRLGNAGGFNELEPDELIAKLVSARFPNGAGTGSELREAICSSIRARVANDSEANEVATHLIAATPKLSWSEDAWTYDPGSPLDRAEQLLRKSGGPMTGPELCEEYVATFGAADEETADRLMSKVSAAQPRFCRTRDRKWALPSMTFDPYQSLETLMEEAIAASGGVISLGSLQSQLADEAFSSASVSIYASAGTKFILEAGQVRLRSSLDPVPNGLDRSSRIFRVATGIHQGCWAAIIEVDYDGMYKASTAMPTAFGSLMGVPLDGSRVTFEIVGGGRFSASGQLTGTILHTTGGFRSHLQSIGAVQGDRARIIWLGNGSVAIEVVPNRGSGEAKHRIMTAACIDRPEEIVEDLAYAIGLDRNASNEQVLAQLSRRRSPTLREDLLAFISAQSPRTEPPSSGRTPVDELLRMLTS